uniref:Uncharacterized protein n=1 Tax=Arundo donax TaxID=35708 RepID=A0A0A9EJ54_ARUDO
MCRHTTKEISSVMSYRVVHDDNNFPPCELQSLTSRLCSFRHRRENPRIDTVVPAYLACKWVVEEFREMEEH